MADEPETERVTFTIANLRTLNGKRLYALVDVEVQVVGLSFGVLGVQIRRDSNVLSVRLPTHRNTQGLWKPVVTMPDEVLEPLRTAVMEYLVEEGVARHR